MAISKDSAIIQTIVPRDVKEKYEQLAKASGLSLSAWARFALKRQADTDEIEAARIEHLKSGTPPPGRPE